MIDHDTRALLTNPMRQSLDAFEKRNVPTLLEAKVGMPNSIQGITNSARSLKAFANGIKSTINDVGKTHFKISADATLTDALKLTRSATYAKSRIKEKREQFRMIADDAEMEYGRLSSKIKEALKAPTSAGQAAIDSELRALVRGMKPVEAQQAIRENPDLLAAVAKAPSVLSGLSSDVHETLKGEYLETVLPEEYGQYKDLKEALMSANTALTTLEQESESLIDFDTAEKFEKQRYVA